MATSNPLRVLTADHEIRFNAVLDHWTGVGDSHAAGYRQATEILLRRLLADPGGTAGERDSVVLLWAEVQELCDAVYGPPTVAEFEAIGHCVDDLRQLDPNSESFRYPRDHNGRPIFEHLVIGIKALSATVASIADCLDGISLDMSVRVQDRA
ncbi:MAG: hypothetical protein HYS14_06765 [Candidatus Rokubacteria bacterium]|nr:hypothetical protein [Candidatus Rokubacteria bacterium]